MATKPQSPPSMIVNLLPPEVIMLKKQSSKLSWANKFSVAMLIVLVFATATTFAVRLLQNSSLNATSQNIALAEGRLATLQDKEGYTVTLKDRLTSIQALSGDNKKAELFNAVVSTAPSDTQINLLSLDKTGALTISASSTSLQSLDALLSTLNQQISQKKLIKEVGIESFARGRDGIYRYSLKVVPL